MSKTLRETASRLKTEVKRHQRAREKILSQLAKEIEALPDNPGLKRISNSTFILRSSQLAGGQPWSAFWHNYKSQYKIVSFAIQRAQDPIETMSHIIEDMWVRVKCSESGSISTRTTTYRLNPTVVETLKKFL